MDDLFEWNVDDDIGGSTAGLFIIMVSALMVLALLFSAGSCDSRPIATKQYIVFTMEFPEITEKEAIEIRWMLRANFPKASKINWEVKN